MWSERAPGFSVRKKILSPPRAWQPALIFIHLKSDRLAAVFLKFPPLILYPHLRTQMSAIDHEKSSTAPASRRKKSRRPQRPMLLEKAELEGIKPIFLAKVKVLNEAIAECGLGRYQWELFFSAGFGWFADNIWLQAIAIVMPAIANQA
ncbi:hypothetical protein B0H14DRAFT_1018741 [Mycena olivaceomarginata]|nr:hypothetical protein B0H14DRAFT_1018741 [Mycena olivaceomarginata]